MADQTLYRFYDESQTLLYVGISINAFERAKKHRQEKHWWPEVKKITLVKYQSRTDVLEAERWAIKNEKPLYNKTHAIPGQLRPPNPLVSQMQIMENMKQEMRLLGIKLTGLEDRIGILQDHINDLRLIIKLRTRSR